MSQFASATVKYGRYNSEIIITENPIIIHIRYHENRLVLDHFRIPVPIVF